MFNMKGCSLIRGIHYDRFHCISWGTFWFQNGEYERVKETLVTNTVHGHQAKDVCGSGLCSNGEYERVKETLVTSTVHGHQAKDVCGSGLCSNADWHI